MQRDVGNGMPLNIAANDITFAGDYKTKYMKFGGPQGMVNTTGNQSQNASHGQRLMNLNNPGQSPGGAQAGYQFNVQGLNQQN